MSEHEYKLYGIIGSNQGFRLFCTRVNVEHGDMVKLLEGDKRMIPLGRVAITFPLAELQAFIAHENLVVPDNLSKRKLSQILHNHLANIGQIVIDTN